MDLILPAGTTFVIAAATGSAKAELEIAERLLTAVTAHRDACWRAVAAREVFRDWPNPMS